MALQGNGQLLIKVRGDSFSALLTGPQRFALPNYIIEPLSTAPYARDLSPSEHWLLAIPEGGARVEQNPWDAAHSAAQAKKYAHLVEPDILHQRPALEVETHRGDGLNDHWPPKVGDKEGVSPGWHLGTKFTGFEQVRASPPGNPVKIAHLDTGYVPHPSTPRHMRYELAYDYWDKTSGAIDPGTAGPPWHQPGHGTATLALLAGKHMVLTFGKHTFEGDIGGAPDAQVIPVRIGPSVIHLYTRSMARGLYHALAPNGHAAERCDVVSISHGGLPSRCWADAVNMLYEDGIVVVASAGDSLSLAGLDIASHYTVYPAAFRRVVTVVGVTFNKGPYIADGFIDLQGSWGPDEIMQKAIAAYTPNIVWMKRKGNPVFKMSGGGTSSSTPQVAAACALWLQRYGNKLRPDWRRVAACRTALFESADNKHPNLSELGRGLLRVPEMLTNDRAAAIIDRINKGQIKTLIRDRVSFPFWRVLLGLPPPDSEEEEMYELEVAQVVLDSKDPELRKAAREKKPQDRTKYRALLAKQTISKALRRRLSSLKG